MRRTLLTLWLSAAAAVPGFSQAAAYDVLIAGGRVVDGTGAGYRVADVAIAGDRIAAIGRLDGAAARARIEASGRVVAPGFIDIHTHARTSIFELPQAENYVRQGVTSLIEGNDGSSAFPLGEHFAKLEALGLATNYGSLIGQGTIRQQAMGNVDRAASAEELDRMRRLARQAMREGALGLSTGLFYLPGFFTPTSEVIAIARVVGSLGGFHISHMRDEASGILDSVRETIRIGEEGRLPTQVTHHKIIGKAYHGMTVDTLRMMEEARRRGVDVTLDQYPYTASSTGLSALLPQWAREGTRDDMLRRLADAAQRARIRAEAAERIEHDRGGGDPKNVQLASCAFDASLAGLTLADVTARAGKPVTFENAAETAIQLTEKGECSTVYHAISEDDLVQVLRWPYGMVASDGWIIRPGEGVPHPRSYGTFARVLGRYVRELGVLRLEEAVRKMTSLPAARLGLEDRGLIKPGMIADIVVFDPATVADKATFTEPHQFSVGFEHVLVAGRPVLANGRMTGARPGRILRGPAWRSGS